MLLKSCSRCGDLIPYGSSYCSKCTPIVEAERAERIQAARLKANKQYNKQRDPKWGAFYRGAAWRALSAKRLQDDNFRCAWCGKIATEVDHIIEIKTPEGWERRLDYSNTRALCTDCHNKRHKRFIKKDKVKRK